VSGNVTRRQDDVSDISIKSVNYCCRGGRETNVFYYDRKLLKLAQPLGNEIHHSTPLRI